MLVSTVLYCIVLYSIVSRVSIMRRIVSGVRTM